MATAHELVAQQEPWRLGNPDEFFESQGALSDPEGYSDAASAYATQLGGGDRLVLEMDANDEHALIALKFYGGGTEGQGAVGWIWGVVKTIETSDEFQPTIDKTLFPGVRVIGEGGNAPATMIFDAMGLKSFIVEIAMIVPDGSSADPATSAGVLWRVF